MDEEILNWYNVGKRAARTRRHLEHAPLPAKLKKEGIDIDIITKSTGLTKEEIEQL